MTEYLCFILGSTYTNDNRRLVLCMCLICLYSGFDFKTAIDGSDFVLYSQTTEHVDEIEFPLALRVSRL